MKWKQRKTAPQPELPGYFGFEDAVLLTGDMISESVQRRHKRGEMTTIPDTDPNGAEAVRIKAVLGGGEVFGRRTSRIQNLGEGVLDSICYGYNLSRTLLRASRQLENIDGLPDMQAISFSVGRRDLQAAADTYDRRDIIRPLIAEGARCIAGGDKRLAVVSHLIINYVTATLEDQAREVFLATAQNA